MKNNIKTQQFIELLKLNDYLMCELDFNLLKQFNSFEGSAFKFRYYDYLIDAMFELVELHKNYNNILDGVIIFYLEDVYMTMADVTGGNFGIGYDSVLEDLVRYFPELAVAIREEKINELIDEK